VKQYTAFGTYIKKLFGRPVHKVNVDAGFTCPNRDGTIGIGGCIYCNNDSFRPSSCSSILPIRDQIQNGIAHLRKRYGTEKFIVYFQPYTNTYAPVSELQKSYSEALQVPDVVGLAIGTRPDCVDDEKIQLLEELARDNFILVEYGLQSVYDKSLLFMKRGHNYDTFLQALELTKERGIHIGAHIIVGFPTERDEEMLKMAGILSELPLGFLKIHQLQVVKDTLLAIQYQEDPFHTFNYDEYIDFLVHFIERLSPSIVLQRLFATAPDDILIAPRWERGKQELLRDVDARFIELDTYQGRLFRKDSQAVFSGALSGDRHVLE
jgi:radical SAM protein (TIGR01212 family)